MNEVKVETSNSEADEAKEKASKPANEQKPKPLESGDGKPKDCTSKSADGQAKDDADQFINHVTAAYMAAVQNGLFSKDPTYATISEEYQNAIKSARDAFKAEDYEKAITYAGKAEEAFSELIQLRGFFWRLWNEYAFHWLLWLTAWTLILGWLGYTVYLTSPQTNPQVYTVLSTKLTLPISAPLRLLLLTGLAGSIGAVLRGLFWVGYQVSAREYKRTWSTEVFSSPFVGLLFGLFVYITVAAGLLATTQSTVPKSVDFDLAAAFVVGFNWKTAESFLERIGTGIFGDNQK